MTRRRQLLVAAGAVIVPRTAVVAGITTQLVLLYSVNMAALVPTGVGLRVGVLPGPAPFGLTVVPAIFAAVVIVAALAMVLIPAELPGRLGRVVAALGSGVRGAIELLRSRDWRLLGALAWWGFDIGVLWACFHAFSGSPELSVLVLVYFVGMLANLLPLPGGVGGVDGGMIGTAIGFGIDGGLAIVARPGLPRVRLLAAHAARCAGVRRPAPRAA